MMTNKAAQSLSCHFEKIVIIGPDAIPAWRQLRLRGLREHPESFGQTAEAFQAKSDAQLVASMQEHAEFGGFTLAALSKTGELLGTVSLMVRGPGKSSHRAELWGMYVIPQCRGQGVGQQLIQELITRAEQISGLEQIHLGVVTSNDSAVALYKKMRFETYGTDPRVLKVGEQVYDEFLMVRRLDHSC